LLGRPIERAELEALAEEKEAAYRELFRPHLAPMAGAPELLERLARSGVRLAVASAAPRANRELVLTGLQWERRFERVVGAEDAPRGKPAPDLYLAAACALGVEPAACVAFEDAVNGVQSAVSAGMAAAGVLSTTPAELLHQSGARWTMRDFTQLPAELERALFG
jgi:HAD superfamily hydrolase (TIGR01509 family)